MTFGVEVPSVWSSGIHQGLFQGGRSGRNSGFVEDGRRDPLLLPGVDRGFFMETVEEGQGRTGKATELDPVPGDVLSTSSTR